MPSKWPVRLVDWFRSHQRTMPWRSNPEPYYVWISEIMLQQTQVDTVIPYFERFIQQFPSIHELAKADLQAVLKQWEGLGYYSRARNLHKAANSLVNETNGQLPTDYAELQKIPGIGPYIAAAVTSIAFNNPVPVVDGNVLRVFSRYWGIDTDIRLPKARKDIFERLSEPIQSTPPSEFNQAIMELGALLCKPTNPKCEQCPLRIECYAYTRNKTTELPVKSKKAPVPHYSIAVGIIQKDDQLLIAKRKESQMLGGLWEFPGGKQRKSETLADTVKREINEETGLDVTVQDELIAVKHTYSHFKITLHAFHCTVITGTPSPNCSDEIKWVTIKDLDRYPFPTANQKIISALKAKQID